MTNALPKLLAFGLLSLGLAATGCASSNLSAQEIAAPRTRIAEAERANAAEHPIATEQIELAEAEVDRAEELMEDGENDAARRALARASVDAEFAVELARLEDTKRDSAQTLREIEQLRRDNAWPDAK